MRTGEREPGFKELDIEPEEGFQGASSETPRVGPVEV